MLAVLGRYREGHGEVICLQCWVGCREGHGEVICLQCWVGYTFFNSCVIKNTNAV